MSVTIEGIMNLPVMQGARLMSATGGNNVVQHITVTEAPKIHFPNYNEGIFVLTTLSAYCESVEKCNDLVRGLCEVNVAAIGIKLGRFIDRIDPSTVEIAERYHVALIALPPSVYFRDIISEVFSAIAGRQKELLNQINTMNEMLLDSIVHNCTIQSLLDLLCERIDCYCSCVSSPEEKIAESSSLRTDIDAQKICSAVAEFFANPAYHESGYHCDGIDILPCIVQKRLLAALCIVSHQDPELIQPLSQSVVSGVCIKLLERDLKDQAERGVIASLLDDILFSNRTDTNVALERLSSLNFVPRRNFQILILTSPFIYQDLNWPHIVGNIQSAFSAHFPSVLAFKRGAECVVFLSYNSDIPSDKMRKTLGRCLSSLERLEANNFYIGCSTPAQDLSMMSECYRQAKKSLAFGRAVGKEDQIYLYIDYFEMGLIAHGLSSSEADLFRERIIDPILGYDVQTNSGLWRTLEVSFTGKTLDQIAQELHIHISTLRYRLQKIENITSYSFFNQNDRIKLYMAYILHKVSDRDEFS